MMTMCNQNIIIKCIIFSLFWLPAQQLNAKELAFEGAHGFGKYTIGGKNGKVYRVTTLTDSNKPGSLRYGINLKHPRQIHFDVSGVIKLIKPLKVKYGYLSILGQTSPRGIAIVGAPVSIKSEQVILRHLRIRLGTYGYEDDALTVRYSKDIIIDHCSFSWGTDETASLYGNIRFTLQNSIIANSLNDSLHKKGEHGYGGIWGGNKASFINNIIANHKSRTPRINGHRLKSPYSQEQEYVELLNNVIFNWGTNSVYGNESGVLSIVNNYYIPGPDSKPRHFFDQSYHKGNPVNQIFISGNIMHSNNAVSLNNRQNVIVRDNKKKKLRGDVIPHQTFANGPLFPLNLNRKAKWSIDELINDKNVGAYKTRQGKFHDSIDTAVLEQIQNELSQASSGSLIIDHENENIKNLKIYNSEFEDK